MGVDVTGIFSSVSQLSPQEEPKKRKFDLDKLLQTGTKIAGAVAPLARSLRQPSSSDSTRATRSTSSSTSGGYYSPQPEKSNKLLYVGIGAGVLVLLGLGLFIIKNR